jgi:hypothetical protein
VPAARIRDDQTLPNGVDKHLAERDKNIANGSRCLALRLELDNQIVNVFSAQGVKRALAEARQNVTPDVYAVSLERRRASRPRPPAERAGWRAALFGSIVPQALSRLLPPVPTTNAAMPVASSRVPSGRIGERRS